LECFEGCASLDLDADAAGVVTWDRLLRFDAESFVERSTGLLGAESLVDRFVDQRLRDLGGCKGANRSDAITFLCGDFACTADRGRSLRSRSGRCRTGSGINVITVKARGSLP